MKYLIILLLLAGCTELVTQVDYTDEPPGLTGGVQISVGECINRMYQHIHEENIDVVMADQIALMCELDSWRDFLTNK